MQGSNDRGVVAARVLLWIARVSALAAIVPLMQIAFGEPGSGPSGPRETIYLALFPFGFSIGYLLGWRWPRLGGWLSLACMAGSLLVIDRNYDFSAYLYWAVLCVPGVLYVVAGWQLRAARVT